MSRVVPERACPKMKNFSRGKNCLISASSMAVMAGIGLRLFFLRSPLRRMRAALLKRESIVRGSPLYLFQLSMTSPARQTKIPVTFTQFNLSLKTKIATGTRINEATTLVSTAAMPRFQPER